MKAFCDLFYLCDSTSKTSLKIEYLKSYFQSQSQENSIWAIYLLSGNKIKRYIATSKLREIAHELTGLGLWLIEESYDYVGDLAETLAKLPIPKKQLSTYSLNHILTTLQQTQSNSEDQKKEIIKSYWQQLSTQECFIFNKIITGGFRVGVSRQIIIKALAAFLNQEPALIAHKLMGNWQPTEEFYKYLSSADPVSSKESKPYPFYLAYPLETPLDNCGDISQWIIEYKYDGIRAQLIKRNNRVLIWSRGEELITDQFPEILDACNTIDYDVVLDGEICVIDLETKMPRPFNDLQKRLQRKKVSKALQDKYPVAFIVYDMLEYNLVDIRSEPLVQRKDRLSTVFKNQLPARFCLSLGLKCKSWEHAAQIHKTSRENHVEGFMLKKAHSIYAQGRKKGEWWKYKIEPLCIDVVLIYAQKGHGIRAGLYSDYTLAVYNHDKQLVPVAKAYSGLTNKEMASVDAYIKKNITDRFGPIRAVRPKIIFEIAFEGIQKSSRHKAGFSLRFPRIKRLREDLTLADIDTTQSLEDLYNAYSI